MVAQDTADDELEGMFEDFFPAVGATGFSLITRVRKAELTDRKVWVALDGRAFKSERLVKVENAAK